MTSRQRLLSGIKPTGQIHLGNLYGALRNWIRYQDQFDSFFMIADLHALTTVYEDTQHIHRDCEEFKLDLLAIGLDPARCTLFVQSDVPEHAELHLLLSMITPLPWLLRVPTYKGTQQELSDRDLNTYGFLGYPMLQAADILIYQADAVPVGKDQLPHLELTREVARRFNHLFSDTFPIPKELLTEIPMMFGTDGRKMSKSYNNAIYVFEDESSIVQKIKMTVTDPARIRKDDPGHPEVCPLFSLHGIFNSSACPTIEAECRQGQRGCVQCKKECTEQLLSTLKPFWEKKEELKKDPGYVESVYTCGAQKAHAVAADTLATVKSKMRLTA